MAGTVNITHQNHRTIKEVIWDWIATAGGAADGQTTFVVSGEILRITTNPGSAAPTDNYDAVINDEDGIDVARGELANRDTATSEDVTPVMDISNRVVVDSKLNLIISNAGSAGAGVVRLYYR